MTKYEKKAVKIYRCMDYREWSNFRQWATDISFIACNIIHDRTKDAKPAYIDEDGEYVFEENDPDFETNVRRLKRDGKYANKPFSLQYPERDAYLTTPEYRELTELSRTYQTCFLGQMMVPLYYEKTYKGAVEMFWRYAQDKQKVSQDIVDLVQQEYEKFGDAARQAGQHRREQKAALTANLKRIGG